MCSWWVILQGYFVCELLADFAAFRQSIYPIDKCRACVCVVHFTITRIIGDLLAGNSRDALMILPESGAELFLCHVFCVVFCVGVRRALSPSSEGQRLANESKNSGGRLFVN